MQVWPRTADDRDVIDQTISRGGSKLLNVLRAFKSLFVHRNVPDNCVYYRAAFDVAPARNCKRIEQCTTGSTYKTQNG